MVDLILGSDRDASAMRLTGAKRRARPGRFTSVSPPTETLPTPRLRTAREPGLQPLKWEPDADRPACSGLSAGASSAGALDEEGVGAHAQQQDKALIVAWSSTEALVGELAGRVPAVLDRQFGLGATLHAHPEVRALRAWNAARSRAAWALVLGVLALSTIGALALSTALVLMR